MLGRTEPRFPKSEVQHLFRGCTHLPPREGGSNGLHSASFQSDIRSQVHGVRHTYSCSGSRTGWRRTQPPIPGEAPRVASGYTTTLAGPGRRRAPPKTERTPFSPVWAGGAAGILWFSLVCRLGGCPWDVQGPDQIKGRRPTHRSHWISHQPRSIGAQATLTTIHTCRVLSSASHSTVPPPQQEGG